MGPAPALVEAWLLQLPRGVAVLSPVHDADGRVVDLRYEYTNLAHERVVGHRREDVIGRLLTEVHRGPEVHDVIDSLAEVVLGTEPTSGAIRTRRGTVHVTASRVGDHIVVAVRDPAEELRSDPTLRELLESLETSSDFVGVVDPVLAPETREIVDMRIRYLTDGTLRRLHLAPEDAVDRRVTDVFPAMPAEFLAGVRQVALTGVPYIGEAVIGTERFSGAVRFVATAFDGGVVVATRDTSAEMQTRAALAHSEAQFRATVEALYEAIFVAAPVRDLDGQLVDLRYELVNQAALDMIGKSRDEVVGRTLSELFPAGVAAAVERCREVLETGTPVVHDAISTDGTRVFEARIARSVGGLVGAVRDVTARRQAAQALADSERRYRLLADHAADVVLLSRYGGTEWVAPSIEQLVGYTPEEFAAIPLMDWVHADDVPIVVQSALALAQGGGAHARLRAKHRDGSYIWVEIVLRLIPEYDEIGDAVVATVWNIDAQVQAEQELQRAEHARRVQEEHIQQASRLESLGVMAGGIAHDFNNLLVGVLGNAEMALHALARAESTGSTEPIAAAVERLGNVVLAAQRAGELTRQLLDYAGRRPRGRDPIDLRDLVAELPGLVAPRLGDATELVLDVADGPCVVVGDRGQLQQVLMNLVINAGDAVGDGPGRVLVRVGVRSEGAVAGDASGGDDTATHAVVEVADDGAGIDPDALGRIFEPFFSTRSSGRGLGLAVAHGIVRSHGGRIDVTSQLGVGTTMTVLLPTTDAVAVPVAPVVAPTSLTNTPLVLVVDDDEVVAEVSATVLRTGSLEVEVETDPLQAIERFRARSERYGAVLLDLTMPAMRGDRVLTVLREIDPAIPVVVVSGYADADLDGTLDALGVNAFVRKPYRAGELLTTVVAVLRPTPATA